mmetsp:Transcript_22281/g.61892  ORF Transcript_22281/g.61892 Transcript_22281/m.61892 type:complete len:358 (-) Transcript_22281:55-1128(-)
MSNSLEPQRRGVLCLLNSLMEDSTEIVYVGLLVAALSAPLAPTFMKPLAWHGKTRSFHQPQQQQQPQSNKKTLWLNFDIHRWVVPKRFFAHFYILGFVSMALKVACEVYCNGGPQGQQQQQSPVAVSPVSLVLRFVMILHIARRYWECIAVHVWNSHSQMHVAGYVVGLLHYLCLPWALFPHRKDTTIDGVDYFRVILAGCVAIWAQYQQHRHHVLLANLRRPNTNRATTTTTAAFSEDKESGRTTSSVPPAPHQRLYQFPRGGWFQWLSCPHYFAELLLYTSLYAMAAGGSPHGSALTTRRVGLLWLWVATNLMIMARESHVWYQQQSNKHGNSNDRDKDNKNPPVPKWAMIPFLF